MIENKEKRITKKMANDQTNITEAIAQAAAEGVRVAA